MVFGKRVDGRIARLSRRGLALSPILGLLPLLLVSGRHGERRETAKGGNRGRNTRQFIGLYVRLSVSLGRVFVSVCIAVPSAKRRVQERAEVHEHVLHGDVHRRVHTEDRRIRRQGKLHYTNKSHLPSSNRLSKERTRLE